MDGSFYSLYLLLFLALYVFTKHFLHKIQNLPPNPFPSLPIIGHLYLLKKPLHRTLTKISDKYGPIVFLRFGSRSVIVVSSPSLAEECLTKYDVTFANRPRLLAGKILGYNHTSIAWASYGDHWRNLRRISSVEILASNRLQMLSEIRADEVRSLIRRISRASREDPNGTVEMKSVFFELTLNVMMRMIAGKRYYGENEVELEEATKFREVVTETFRLGDASNIVDFLPFVRFIGLNGVEKRLRAVQQKRDRFMQYLIEEHRRMRKEQNSCDLSEAGERKKTKTMIDVLLSLQETEPDYYKDEIIRGLMLALLSAGTDTSAGTMEWALSLLLNNPETLKKTQVEIEERVGSDRLISESDLSQLPYLRSVINETLRMCPPGPLSVPHESSDLCSIGGFHVPRGTMLLVNLWAIQNNPKIWAEPRKFKPERFEGLEGDRDGFKFMPFGSGRRGCPGEGLAVRIVGLALGSLIQCFEWERVDETLIDLTEGTGLTMPKAHPLRAKCRPRPIVGQLVSQI